MAVYLGLDLFVLNLLVYDCNVAGSGAGLPSVFYWDFQGKPVRFTFLSWER
jgi:hypothetical protein